MGNKRVDNEASLVRSSDKVRVWKKNETDWSWIIWRYKQYKTI